MTPDFDSLEITGGEPLLHSTYIKEFLTKYPYKTMLETNATLPKQLKEIKDVIDIVSMDIKLPEHFNSIDEWKNIYENELKSVQVMEDEEINYYIKIVVSPKTPLDLIEEIVQDLKLISSSEVEIIVQPISPMTLWETKEHLFEISEIIGKNFSVSILPQIHKYLNVE